MLSFLKKYKVILIAAAAVVAALVFAFMMGGSLGDSAPVTAESTVPTVVTTAAQSSTAAQTASCEATAPGTTAATTAPMSTATATTAPSSVVATTVQPTQKPSSPQTEPVPTSNPKKSEPTEKPTEAPDKTVTISVNCSTVFDNMKKLKSGKAEIIPEDGYILSPTTVKLTEGESVFDVLLRVCTDKGVHMDYRWTPIYNSAYIMGIGNLYEFDCGGNSGWMYRVDGTFPNYGCSRCSLEGGENIEFLYTCKLGYDIGGGAQQVDE